MRLKTKADNGAATNGKPADSKRHFSSRSAGTQRLASASARRTTAERPGAAVAAGAVERARRESIETTLFEVETAVLEHVGLTRRVDDEAAGAVTARQRDRARKSPRQ